MTCQTADDYCRTADDYGRWRTSRQVETWMNTPKAFANFSPGFERSENPGIAQSK